MGVSAIFFDLDGTLADTLPGIQASVTAAVAAVLPQARVPDLRDLIGPPVREILETALGEQEPEVFDEIDSEFRRRYDRDGWRNCCAYAGVSSTLDRLVGMGIENYVATNKPIAPAKKVMDELQLTAFFRDIISRTSRTPPFSSKLEMVSHIVRSRGLKADGTVLVGDSADDAYVARNLGISFFAAAYGYGRVHLRNDLPRRGVLQEFSELPGLLEGID